MDSSGADMAEAPREEGQLSEEEERELALKLLSKDYAPEMCVELFELMQTDANHADDRARLHGARPLHCAVALGRADVAEFMLARGYEKDVLDDNGRTPLHLAVYKGNMDVMQVFLGAGADANHRCGNNNSSPLDVAVDLGHVGIARLLLEHGVDANATPANGSTPLHSAAASDRPDMVSMLCRNGADVNKIDATMRTPLQVTAREGHTAAARALLAAGADATLRQDGHGESALGEAAVHGHVDMLMAMIEHGVDMTAAREHGVTALHMAASFGRTAAIDVLMAAGADIEARLDVNRSTPLFLAAKRNNPAAVVVLLRHGACVCNRDAADRTALHYLVAFAGRPGTADVVDLMLKHGADEKAVDRHGKAPADVVGLLVNVQYRVADDVERVRKLLAKAPANRAWRRRRFLVLCRAHYPSGRVQLGQGATHAHDHGTAKRTRGNPEPSRAEAEWAGVASMLMGVGADPISLMGDGADIIFETIVGFL